MKEGWITINKLLFQHKPVSWLPFNDSEIISKAREMTREDIETHSWENEEFKVKIVEDVQSHFVIDLFNRIHQSHVKDQKLTVILPNPYAAVYENLALLCNKYEVNCRNLNVFFLNEWANEEGQVAPLDYPSSYGRIFQKYFYGKLNPELRPDEKNIHYFTTENVKHYSDMIDETGDGGADVCYTAIGWSGRIASIEPEGEFICNDMDTYLKQTSRIVTNHIISIAEDSICGLFGHSGDLAAVPPKSATIGPRDIAHARDHIEMQYKKTVDGGTSWQSMISRLMFFGPITMSVPASILRMFKGTCFIDERVAKDIKRVPDYPDDFYKL